MASFEFHFEKVKSEGLKAHGPLKLKFEETEIGTEFAKHDCG